MQEEALQDLWEGKGFRPLIQGDPNQVLCTEIIYYTTNPASEYFLPYYKFYLSSGDAPVNYAEPYVPAVKNEYLILTDERDEN